MMSNDRDLVDNELKIKIPTRAIVLVSIWLILSFIISPIVAKYFFMINLQTVSIGEFGAYLSGVFSVLAFYGFIEAYLIQSQELRLQRFELKESIKAQKGSEQALKEQSEALKSQLKISEEQFNLYLLEAKAKIPVFTLLKIHTFKVEFLHKENRISNEIDLLEDSLDLLPFEKDLYKLKDIVISIEVNNIGGGGRLIGAKGLMEVDSDYYIQSTSFDVMTSSMTNTDDNYLIKFKYQANSISLDVFSSSEIFKKFIMDCVESIKFETNFRGRERSYKQNYKICRNSLLDLLLQHNSTQIINSKEIDTKNLLIFGYEIEMLN